MSGTRTAKPGNSLRQERWASDPVLSRGLKANLVALRLSLVESALDGQLIWALQYLSHQAGGLAMAAQALKTTEAELAKVCLDPRADVSAIAPDLTKFFSAYRNAQASGIAETEVFSAVGEALEYCHERRCLVIVSGNARIGKTFAAKHWCESNPGRARYVQVPSSADDLAFFSALANSLGITIESNAKTKNLRPRIEAALRSGNLALVLDEAAMLWPGHNYRLARPSRVCWLMTALVNQGVPVALIVTPEFFRTQKAYERKSGFNAEQFDGRIERFIPLPERLCLADLKRVAAALLPEGDECSIDTLAAYADLSSKHVAAIQHAVSHARFIAKKNGRSAPVWADVRQGIRENILPTDSRVLAALKDFARGDVRERSAAKSPQRRGVPAGEN